MSGIFSGLFAGMIVGAQHLRAAAVSAWRLLLESGSGLKLEDGTDLELER